MINLFLFLSFFSFFTFIHVKLNIVQNRYEFKKYIPMKRDFTMISQSTDSKKRNDSVSRLYKYQLNKIHSITVLFQSIDSKKYYTNYFSFTTSRFISSFSLQQNTTEIFVLFFNIHRSFIKSLLI